MKKTYNEIYNGSFYWWIATLLKSDKSTYRQLYNIKKFQIVKNKTLSALEQYDKMHSEDLMMLLDIYAYLGDL